MTSGRVAHCDLGNLLPTDLQLSSATDASYTLMCLPRSEWEEQCQPGWLQVYPPSRQYVTLGTCAMRTHLSRFLTFGSGRPVQVCHRDCRGWSGTLARGVNSHGWRVSHCSGYEEMSKSPRPDKPSLAFFNLSAPGTDDNWPRAAPAALAFSSGEASGSNDWDVSRRVWISCMGGRVFRTGATHMDSSASVLVSTQHCSSCRLCQVSDASRDGSNTSDNTSCDGADSSGYAFHSARYTSCDLFERVKALGPLR